MKKSFIFLLVTGLLLTGCTAQDKDNMRGNENVVENISETTDTPEENRESDTPEENRESETTEEAPYILTFEANTIDGEVITSDCFAESKLTMLNVWATYCNPCLSEMPDLGEIATSYDSEEFQILGIISDVVEDASEEELENAKDLITQTSANYPHLLLNQSLYTNLVGAVDSVPTTFFINQEGELLGYVVGARTKDVWEELINDLLAEME